MRITVLTQPCSHYLSLFIYSLSLYPFTYTYTYTTTRNLGHILVTTGSHSLLGQLQWDYDALTRYFRSTAEELAYKGGDPFQSSVISRQGLANSSGINREGAYAGHFPLSPLSLFSLSTVHTNPFLPHSCPLAVFRVLRLH